MTKSEQFHRAFIPRQAPDPHATRRALLAAMIAADAEGIEWYKTAGTCYFCGGTTGPDGNGGYVCQECGRTQ